MKTSVTRVSALLALLSLVIFARAQGPLPSAAQVEWQKMENYAFIHFGPNTVKDVEWGYGDFSPRDFNPTLLDCDKWAATLKDGGMKQVIIVAKHHDGFCLWPSKYTDYSIASSPYRAGKGDIVGEMAAACRKYGLKFGVYLSPWDRNRADYGQPSYIEYYKKQLRELLTNYGEISEVWLDGANGGDGYYGGACEKREIDRRTYYGFESIFALIHELQPNAIIFSDGGPGCRWVGNEKGIAGETNWSFLRYEDVYPGYPKSDELTVGHVDGTKWIPAECDVSIRPGWFYHSSEDGRVKTGQELFALYLKSVGRNGTFLLNVPPDANGVISDTDARSLAEYRKIKDAAFAVNLLAGADIKASSRKSSARRAANVADSDYCKYWTPADKDGMPTVTFRLKSPVDVKYVVLQEYIPYGQHVAEFAVEYSDGTGHWLPLPCNEQTTTIGYKRILPCAGVRVSQLRVRFLSSRGSIHISNISAY